MVQVAVRLKQPELSRQWKDDLADALVNLCTTRPEIQRLIEAIRAKEKEITEMRERLGGAGVCLDYDGAAYIEDARMFRAAGGRYPDQRLCSYEGVMQALLAATPEEGRAILVNLGINWS